ncbi:DUF86 domain-containing protein [Nocardioides ferulae]|uniref:HepT-like ribonuclease domain-containing protein n=1 Tax=Nocardioides ferulae TaxID=2340821 RepID=UPI000EB3D85B|nr:HepT-like ribonuclease domain-containing protein [Nocardioides ferulae]
MTGPSLVDDADRRHVAELARLMSEAARIVERGEQTFLAQGNPVEFLAGRMLIIDVDTAAERISADFKAAHPGDWRALARARDKYAHHYDDIDRVLVWRVLANRFPAWREQLLTAIGESD